MITNTFTHMVTNMTQIREKSNRQRTTDKQNRLLEDLEAEIIAQMAGHKFFNVPTPLDLSGTRVDFIETFDGKEINAWYRASLKEEGLLITYNAHHTTLKHDESDGKKIMCILQN